MKILAAKLNTNPYEVKLPNANLIPEDYKYDTETEDFFVYRNKYTGKEIHISKDPLEYPSENAITLATDVIRELQILIKSDEGAEYDEMSDEDYGYNQGEIRGYKQAIEIIADTFGLSIKSL